ncbi:MAG: hypothetical protein LBB57_06645 [Clostridiales Family XIII bacterium]|jgi:hypothetical protein|nr:hypothetical protein [Clostridiales Family XIII bacterium]
MRVALSNLEYFDLRDAENGGTVKGGDQDWYSSWWRRMAGCGPTTATNAILYLTNARVRAASAAGDGALRGGTDVEAQGAGIRDKREFVQLMDRVWKHVTPGRGGINTTTKLRRGIAGYSDAAGLGLRTEALDISDDRDDRPPLAHIVEFIRTGLERDLPVAFLNLHNGSELQLDRWHWVTITGMEYEEAGGAARIDILDNCNLLGVNLGRWLSSAARGGGFVRFLL